MPWSLPSYSSVPGLSLLLVLIVSVFVLLDSREFAQDRHEVFLDEPTDLRMISTPLDRSGAKDGPGSDFAFGSRDDSAFPNQEGPTFTMEDEVQATHVWPRLLLDYMKHQLRFRGRTKKSTKKGCVR